MSEASGTAERVTLELTLDAAPEKVWRALSIPEYRDSWLTSGADAAGITTEVLEAEPPRRLTLSWRDGDAAPDERVTFTLLPTPDGGTWLRLVHDRLPLPLPVPANANGATLLLAA